MDEEEIIPVKDSDIFRENAENCMQLSERAPDEPTANRYRRMATAWRDLADEQDWLDGHVPPKGAPSRLDTSHRA